MTEKTMKILYIVNSTINGGATISFMNLICGMIDKGVVPIIVTPEDVHEDFACFLAENNIKNYKISMSQMLWPKCYNWHVIIKYPFLLFKLVYNRYESRLRLKRIIEIEKPDIIHTNVGTIHCGFEIAQKLGIPHIWHLREYQDKDFGWKIFPTKKHFKSMLGKSFVISITQDILKYFSLDKNPNAFCIYNGILSYDNIKMVWPKEKFFITANNLVPAKSMETTIIGFAEFFKKHNDFKLKICGVGKEEYVKKLKKIASEYSCYNNIEWLGFVGNIPELLSKARGLIISSRNEGFGRMTAEACFMGCMPIGRNTGGTKEIITHTGGMLFNTVEELTKMLNCVAELDEDEYMRIMMLAQEKARNSYSIESNVNKIYEVYKKALK